jgi:hypothetical protein
MGRNNSPVRCMSNSFGTIRMSFGIQSHFSVPLNLFHSVPYNLLNYVVLVIFQALGTEMHGAIAMYAVQEYFCDWTHRNAVPEDLYPRYASRNNNNNNNNIHPMALEPKLGLGLLCWGSITIMFYGVRLVSRPTPVNFGGLMIFCWGLLP